MRCLRGRARPSTQRNCCSTQIGEFVDVGRKRNRRNIVWRDLPIGARRTDPQSLRCGDGLLNWCEIAIRAECYRVDHVELIYISLLQSNGEAGPFGCYRACEFKPVSLLACGGCRNRQRIVGIENAVAASEEQCPVEPVCARLCRNLYLCSIKWRDSIFG